MGLFSNIGQKISGGLSHIGQKVGGAVANVGSKVSKYAGIGANIAGKLAMGAAVVQPELAPALAGAAATLRGIQGVADIASAGGRALQGGDIRGAIRSGMDAVASGRRTAQDARNMFGQN